MTQEINIARKQDSRIVCGESITAAAALLSDEREIIVIHDQNVSWAAAELVRALEIPEKDRVKACIAIEADEAHKTMETVLDLSHKLLEADASRGAFLLAVGGGITTDISGFVAATYKRGIRYGNLPTTLLAQVDAAIGGKTGVNLDGYKNMLGAFHLPLFTYLCPEVLQTLPAPVFREGLAELLKTFLLADGAAYERAVRFFADAQNDREALLALIQKAAQIKAGIVQRDPFEGGERAKLNLGHSFAHAIEHEAARRGEHLPHGEAVGIGTIMAAELSEQLGVAEKGLAARLRADFNAIGLKVTCPYPVPELVRELGKDKKAAGGCITFVLPVRPGEVILKELPIYDLHFPTK